MALLKKIIILIIVLILTAGSTWLFFNLPKNNIQNNSQGNFQITDEEIVRILKQNKDAAGYFEKYQDFRIIEKKLLSEEEISAGKLGQNFKEIYQNLVLENSRYLKVQIINTAGDRGLIATLDWQNKTPVSVYGLLLLGAGAGSTNFKP